MEALISVDPITKALADANRVYDVLHESLLPFVADADITGASVILAMSKLTACVFASCIADQSSETIGEMMVEFAFQTRTTWIQNNLRIKLVEELLAAARAGVTH